MKKNLVVSAFFVLLIIVTTYPLVFNINSFMPAFFSTDESFGIIWNAWLGKFVITNHLAFAKTDFIAYPFGIALYSKLIAYVWFTINFLLFVLTTPVLSYNLQVLFNIFLTAFLTYLLVFYLTKNRFSAILSGIIFGFCPYMFVRSWQHLGATYLWPIPLFLLFFFRLKDDDSLKVRVFFILSFILSTVNFDITYYLLVTCCCFTIFLLFNFKKNAAFVKKIVLLMTISFIILAPQAFPILKNIIFNRNSVPLAQNVFHRPFEDLFVQSSRILSFFLPSVAHPLFGEFTKQFVGTQLYGISFTEHTLYLGWLPIILSLFAIRCWKKKTNVRLKDNYYIGLFLLLAVVAWFFTQPPWWKIGPLKIYMPSFFMYKVLPMIRAYCRFGVVVIFSVSVLAGFGLKFILDKIKGRNLKIVITGAACLIVLFEFWCWPPYKVLDVSLFPAVYSWLKDQPDDTIIAEYPLDAVSTNEMYKLFQTKHEKKMINGTTPGTPANIFAKTITKLSDSKTAGVIKGMGVKFAIVHHGDYLETGLVEDKIELEKIPQNKGLKLIGIFPPEVCPDREIMCIRKTGPIDVYEVIAEPIEFKEKN